MILFILALTIALLVIDWAQTRFIAKNPARFREINVILGEHPSVRAVNIYFAYCIILVIAGAIFLPFWPAVGAGGALIALEVFITIRNYKHGVRFV